MSRISISRRSAEVLYGIQTSDGLTDPVERRAMEELRRALEVGPKKAAAQRTRRAAVKAKAKTKRTKTSAIYKAVETRAEGRCESCGGQFWSVDPPELDHQLGRGKYPQSVENTWMIHRTCHRRKTGSDPSALFWVERMLSHAQKWEHEKTINILSARAATMRIMEHIEVSP